MFFVAEIFSQTNIRELVLAEDSERETTAKAELYSYQPIVGTHTKIEFSPSGKLFATYLPYENPYSNAVIWNTETGKQIKKLSDDEIFIWTKDGFIVRKLNKNIIYSPNREYFDAASGSENTEIWNTIDEKELYQIRGDNLTWSSDSEQFCVIENGVINIIEAKTGKILQKISDIVTNSKYDYVKIQFSPRNSYLCFIYGNYSTSNNSDKDNLKIVSLKSGEIEIDYTGDGAKSVWSLDENFICIDEYKTDKYVVFDLSKKTSTEIPIVEYSRRKHPEQWSPDNKYLIFKEGFENDAGYHFFDIEKNKWFENDNDPFYKNKDDALNFSGNIYGLTFSPNGSDFIFYSFGRLFVAKYHCDNEKPIISHIKQVSYGTWSDDFLQTLSLTNNGKYLSLKHGDALKYLNIKTGSISSPLAGYYDFIWSPDNKYLVATDSDNAVIYDVQEQKLLHKFEYDYWKHGIGGGFTSTHFPWSPLSNFVVIKYKDNKIVIFDVKKQKEKEYELSPEFKHGSSLLFYWSNDEQYLAAKIANDNSESEIFNINTGKAFRYSGYISRFENKYIISSSNDGEFKIWNVELEKISSISKTVYIDNMSYSPNGKFIAIESSIKNRYFLEIFNLETIEKVCSFSLGFNRSEMLWHNSSDYFFFIDEDHHTTILDLTTGKTKKLKEYSDSISLSPDCKHLVHVNNEVGISLYNIETGTERMFEIGSEAHVDEWTPDSNYMIAHLYDDDEYDKRTFFVFDVKNGTLKKANDYYEIESFNILQLLESTQYFRFEDIILLGQSFVKLSNADGNFLISVNSNNSSISFYSIETGKLIYTTSIINTDEYLIYTPEGFFCGTEWACKNLVYVVDGLEVTELEQMYDKLYRPDLIAAKVRGEDISEYAKECNFEKLIKTGKPPVVEILAENSISEEYGLYTFNFSVEDAGGGISDVRFLWNDNINLPGGKKPKIEGNKIIYQQTVPLKSGKNTLEVFAKNKAGMIESLHKSISFEWNGQVEKPNLHVLALGINQYQVKRLRLGYAVSDAEAVISAFKSQKSGLYENILVHSLIDDEVTKDGILAKFNELSEQVKKDDVFILYLAGHGITYNCDYYYIPVDYRAADESQIPENSISKEDFVSYLSKINANKKLILIDTCDSGSFSADTSDKKFRGSTNYAEITKLKKAIGSAIITAANDDEKALEGYENHGVFTYTLLQALKGNADFNHDGFVSVAELAEYITTEVPKLNYEQNPQMRIKNQNFTLVETK